MAMRQVGYGPVIDSTGEQTNPTILGAALADTGALPAGVYEVRVTLAASAAAKFAVEHRNAANDAVVDDICVIYIPAGVTAMYLFDFTANLSERFRIKMVADLTGTAAAHIIAKRID